MSLTITACAPADFAAWVELSNRIWPDHRTSLEGMEFGERIRPEHILCYRVLARRDGEPVGLGCAAQSEHSYDPRKFSLEVGVLEAHRRQGIGAACYTALLEAVAEHRPNFFTAWARSDHPHAVRFVTRRGFVEVDREYESRLDLRTFNPAAFDDVFAALRATGVVIKTLAELQADPDWEQRLHRLSQELDRYVPSEEEPTEVPFESWRRWTLENPHLNAPTFLVAECNGEYVGMHNLWKSESGDDQLEVGLTAIQPQHRRRGIALALKVRALAWAKAAGVREMRTWNATHNRPMLSINERLGFVKEPAWITFHRRTDD